MYSHLHTVINFRYFILLSLIQTNNTATNHKHAIQRIKWIKINIYRLKSIICSSSSLSHWYALQRAEETCCTVLRTKFESSSTLCTSVSQSRTVGTYFQCCVTNTCQSVMPASERKHTHIWSMLVSSSALPDLCHDTEFTTNDAATHNTCCIFWHLISIQHEVTRVQTSSSCTYLRQVSQHSDIRQVTTCIPC